MEIKFKEYLTIPNMLSLSRIVFLPLLYILVFLDYRNAFLVSFIVLMLTDLFDGLLARKLNQQTELGKQLDSFADLVFILSAAFFVYRMFPGVILPNMALLIGLLVILAFSLMVSIIKFKKPVLMHTIILKMSAILVFFVVVLSFFTNTVLLVMLTLISYIIGFIEQTLIHLIYGNVDPDTKSIFVLRRK